MSLPAGEGGDGRGGAITSWAGATAGSSRAAACTQGRVASLQGSNAKRRQIYPPAASDLHAPSLFLSASVRLPCRRRLPCGPPPLPLCRRSAAAQGVCHMPLQRVCGGTPAPGTQHGAKAEQLHQGARVRDGGGPHCVARGPDEQEVNDRLNAVDCERFSSSLAGSAHGCCTQHVRATFADRPKPLICLVLDSPSHTRPAGGLQNPARPARDDIARHRHACRTSLRMPGPKKRCAGGGSRWRGRASGA